MIRTTVQDLVHMHKVKTESLRNVPDLDVEDIGHIKNITMKMKLVHGTYVMLVCRAANDVCSLQCDLVDATGDHSYTVAFSEILQPTHIPEKAAMCLSDFLTVPFALWGTLIESHVTIHLSSRAQVIFSLSEEDLDKVDVTLEINKGTPHYYGCTQTVLANDLKPFIDFHDTDAEPLVYPEEY